MTEVLPTNQARAKLNQIAASFDDAGEQAEPVVFGSHRRAQGVIVSWALWQRIAPVVEDVLDAELATERLVRSSGSRLSSDQVAAAVMRGARRTR